MFSVVQSRINYGIFDASGRLSLRGNKILIDPPPGQKFGPKEMAIATRTIQEPNFDPFGVKPASRF